MSERAHREFRKTPRYIHQRTQVIINLCLTEIKIIGEMPHFRDIIPRLHRFSWYLWMDSVHDVALGLTAQQPEHRGGRLVAHLNQ